MALRVGSETMCPFDVYEVDLEVVRKMVYEEPKSASQVSKLFRKAVIENCKEEYAGYLKMPYFFGLLTSWGMVPVDPAQEIGTFLHLREDIRENVRDMVDREREKLSTNCNGRFNGYDTKTICQNPALLEEFLRLVIDVDTVTSFRRFPSVIEWLEELPVESSMAQKAEKIREKIRLGERPLCFGSGSLQFQKDEALCVLPPEISRVENVKEIHISSPDLMSIPKGISAFEHLGLLYVHADRIIHLPDLPGISCLILHSENSKRLPRAVYNTPSLTSLCVEFPNLTEISEDISLLQKLEDFSLSSRSVVSLPQALGGLPSLKSVWIRCKEIKNLPKKLALRGSLLPIEGDFIEFKASLAATD